MRTPRHNQVIRQTQIRYWALVEQQFAYIRRHYCRAGRAVLPTNSSADREEIDITVHGLDRCRAAAVAGSDWSRAEFATHPTRATRAAMQHINCVGLNQARQINYLIPVVQLRYTLLLCRLCCAVPVHFEGRMRRICMCNYSVFQKTNAAVQINVAAGTWRIVWLWNDWPALTALIR